jgi:hypothetical protein
MCSRPQMGPTSRCACLGLILSCVWRCVGVTEHAHFLKELPDAQRIRHAISDCFESAVVPTYALFNLHCYMMKIYLTWP